MRRKYKVVSQTVSNITNDTAALHEDYEDNINCYKQMTLSRKSPNKLYLLLYNLTMPFFVIVTAGLFAYIFKMPFIFPSLGPTAFLHFAVPNNPSSSPKNTLIGHFIGIIAGSLSLQMTGLYTNDAIFIEGVSVSRIFCAATSVGITCCLMVLFKVPHPPSGATTLIVSLGFHKTPIHLSIMMSAVLLITLEAFIINKIFRKDVIYPIWSVSQKDAEKDNKNDNKENIKENKLQNKMDNLTIDNFLGELEDIINN